MSIERINKMCQKYPDVSRKDIEFACVTSKVRRDIKKQEMIQDYLKWKNAYFSYIFDLYNLIKNSEKLYKVEFFKNITIDRFSVFIYNHSSRRISKYV
jgi:hypothetical protein